MAGISPAPHGSKIRPQERGHLSLLRKDGGWGTSMEPRRFPVPKLDMYGSSSFWQKPCPVQASTSRTRVCRSLLPSAGPSLRAGHTLSAAPFFFFSIKSQLKFGYFSPIASPAKTFSGLRPLHVDLPSPSQQPLREPPPPPRDQLLCFLPGAPFSLAPMTEQKCPLQGECGAATWGEREKLIEGCSARGECGCIYLK